MSTIPGASRYLTASTYANRTGGAAMGTDLLSSLSGGVSVLDAGRTSLLKVPGIGLSSNARALNKQFLEKNNGSQLFSAGLGATASVDGLKQQILAIRAGKSTGQLADSLIEIKMDDGTVLSGATGKFVDKEA